RLRSRKRRARENAALVDVLWRIPEPHLAVAPAHEDDRELGLEPDQLLVDEADQRHAHALALACRGEPPLALAVVALAPGLEDPRHADPLDRRLQVAVGGDRGLGCG